MNLTRAAITRPVFVLMLMLAAAMLGLICYNGMRKELNPDISFPVVTVQTQYPGATPQDINELISRPVEEAVSSATGIREVTSTSQEGLSSVVVNFELDVSPDSALSDVRSKVDAIANSLPKDSLKPTVSKLDMSSSPVLYLSFSSSLSSRDLRTLLDDKLADRFAQINGVSQAAIQGGDVREIEIQVSKEKLSAYGIGIADLTNAVSASSLNAPSGKVVNGDREYTVRVKGDFQNVNQIRDMIVTVSDPKNKDGKAKIVKLSDVATITDTSAERTAYSRLDGKDTIVLAISKAKDGNAVDINNAAQEIIAQTEKDYSNLGLKITKTYEAAKQITESIDDLIFTLIFSVFLVGVIVFVFLHNFRGTLIVALAIPTSLLSTFVAMKLLGFTVNNMSLLALSLAVGVLVDDAIVVLENIYRHLKMGEDPREAALNGRMEIGLAALAITMVDVVVFLPIGFMSGIVGQFFKPLALGFVCAVLFSLFVSFTLTPLLAARWYKAGEDMEHPTGAFATAFENGFGRLEHGYRRALEWALTHRWFVFLTGNVSLFAVISFLGGGTAGAEPNSIAKGLTAGIPLLFAAIAVGVVVTVVNAFRGSFSLKYIGAALMFGLAFPFAGLLGAGYQHYKHGPLFKGQFLPASDGGQVQANIQLPPGASLAATQRVVSYVESVIKKDPAVKYVLANVGTQGVGTMSSGSQGSQYAQVQATLWDKASFTDHFHKQTEPTRTRSSDSVAATLATQIGRVPGATIQVSAPSGFGFGSAIQLSFTSDNHELLLATAQKVCDELAKNKIAGVINVDTSSKAGKPELVVDPDRVALGDAGLDVNTLGSAVRTLYQGNNDVKYRENGREYDVRVMLNMNERNDPNVLGQVPVTYKSGNPIYVPSVANIHLAPGVDKITRRSRSEEIMVTADLLPGYANGTVVSEISKWLTDAKMVPEGVHFSAQGQANSQQREMGNMIGSFFLGIILAYMLLASLYDNLLYPFIIQLSQPQAMVGALLALVFTDKDFNLVGFIGIVCLVGLVGKNAILLVDYANTLRDRGRTRHDALVEAGPTRLRPIMMTTLALILGMLPIALALGRGSEFRETIGIIIIGGITLSTMLTLLVIPCSYTIFDDLSIWIGNLFHRGGPAAPTAGTSGTPDALEVPSQVVAD